MPSCTPTFGGMTSSAHAFSVGRFSRAGPAPLIWAPPALVRLVWRYRSPFEGDRRNTCTASRELGGSFPDAVRTLCLSRWKVRGCQRSECQGAGGPCGGRGRGQPHQEAVGQNRRQGEERPERRQGGSCHGTWRAECTDPGPWSWPGWACEEFGSCPSTQARTIKQGVLMPPVPGDRSVGKSLVSVARKSLSGVCREKGRFEGEGGGFCVPEEVLSRWQLWAKL